MPDDWATSRRAFRDATGWFLRTVELVGPRWSAPALGEWDVRALVGHTGRSLLTVEEYLRTPAARAEVASAPEYYRAVRGRASGPAVAARGRAAGEALGDDPGRYLAGVAARVLPDVDGRDGTELVTTVAGGMRLADYLPTRTFELTVHTADLATALGAPLDPPPGPAAQALRIVSDVAVADGSAAVLLLAATGRHCLPAGFSVL